MSRCDEIKKRYEMLQPKTDLNGIVIEALCYKNDIEYLLKENEKLKTALKFYADEKNWDYSYESLSYSEINIDDIDDVENKEEPYGGQKAREALKNE